MKTNYKKLFNNSNELNLEITKINHVDFYTFGTWAILKCGKYSKTICPDINSELSTMIAIINSKEINLENYNNFLSKSIELDHLETDSRVFTIGEIKSSGVLFMKGPTDLVYPFDDFDKKYTIEAMGTFYESFDDIRLSDYAYIYTLGNCIKDTKHGYRIRGVTKKAFQAILDEQENKTSD